MSTWGFLLAVKATLVCLVLLSAGPAHAQSVIWRQLEPLPRLAHTIAFDSNRGVAIMFGGAPTDLYFAANQWLSETWEWSGGSWSHRASSGPSPRSAAAMVYDAARRRVVLFGGFQNALYADAPSFGDTWEWDGRVWEERRIPGPPARHGHTMVYDANRHVVVLFGGARPGAVLDDTWEFDGAAWTQRLVAGPPARTYHAMAYNSVSHTTVLFGGWTSTGFPAQLADPTTWEWNGQVWQEHVAPGPPTRLGHAMTFDAARGVVTLFGGTPGDGTPLFSDFWEWNGIAWSQRILSGPPARSHHVMVYDTVHANTLLFGGSSSDTTWTFDAVGWIRRQLASPSARVEHATCFDAARGVLVLFGGYFPVSRETWEWNGAGWNLRSTGGPSGRADHAMVYDAARGVSVLFGGGDDMGNRSADTWSWNGTDWNLLATTGPSARYGHAMVYDSARAMIILHGGVAQNPAQSPETWEWDGSVWTLKSTNGGIGIAIHEHAMAYDAFRQRTVLFGGQDTSDHRLANTYEWDGTHWELRSSTGPSARYAPAMDYDPLRHVTVLHGGYVEANYTSNPPILGANDETWEWDGTTWTRRFLANPYGRGDACMSYDPIHHAMLLTGGGQPGPHELGDIWSLGSNCPQPCVADFNCDGLVAMQDILDFINAWFAADQATDTNGGGLSVTDVFDFLNAWFAGC